MKDVMATILLFVLFGFLGCIEEEADNTPPFPIAKSNLSQNTNVDVLPTLLEDFVANNNDFAFEFYKTTQQEHSNLVFSPYSISIATGMLYAGAEGSTEQQIAQALHFNLSDPDIHKGFNYLDVSLKKACREADEDEFTLHIMNAVWGQQNYIFLEDYLNTLAIHYGAGINLLDFTVDPEGARSMINGWVANQTKDLIQDLLGPNSITWDTKLVLTNAIYFYGEWLSTFDKDNTTGRNFELLDGSTILVNTMYQEKYYPYVAEEDYKAIQLSYKGDRMVMVIVVPAIDTFNEFENSLNHQIWISIVNSLASGKVDLYMPKWEFDTNIDLVEVLKTMGMEDAFEPGGANFSGIDGTHKLFISNAVHKAYILVDEEGTEAAAATGYIAVPTSIEPEPFLFKIDSPYIYAIMDRETNTILFLGRVLNPAG